MKTRYLYIDQWGNTFFATTVKELCERVGYTKARRMYVSTKDGRDLHVGYVIGKHWLSKYTPVERGV